MENPECSSPAFNKKTRCKNATGTKRKPVNMFRFFSYCLEFLQHTVYWTLSCSASGQTSFLKCVIILFSECSIGLHATSFSPLFQVKCWLDFDVSYTSLHFTPLYCKICPISAVKFFKTNFVTLKKQNNHFRSNEVTSLVGVSSSEQREEGQNLCPLPV